MVSPLYKWQVLRIHTGFPTLSGQVNEKLFFNLWYFYTVCTYEYEYMIRMVWTYSGLRKKENQGSRHRKVGTWLLGGYFGFLTNFQRTPSKQPPAHIRSAPQENHPRSAETALPSCPRPSTSSRTRVIRQGYLGRLTLARILIVWPGDWPVVGVPKFRKRLLRNPTPGFTKSQAA